MSRSVWLPRTLFAFCCLLVLAGCSAPPRVVDDGPVTEWVGTTDGLSLPLARWLPRSDPKAVVVALHGMNDYRNAFARPALAWSRQAIAVYAFDQRGFGAAGIRGDWYGVEAMVDDIVRVETMAARRHPGKPLYLLGESMGAALALLASLDRDAPPLAGLVLASPAAWSDDAWDGLLRDILSLGAWAAPWLPVPSRPASRPVSDDPAVVLQLRDDPLVSHWSRLDMVAGVVGLMTVARRRAGAVRVPTLVLVGEEDDRVPRRALAELLAALPGPVTVGLYPSGRHLLFRSIATGYASDDVAAWILRPDAGLPSGADQLAHTCPGHIAMPDGPCRDPSGPAPEND